MQFTIILTTLFSLTSAAAVQKRYPATLVERQSGVCGGLATPLCCQTDVLGAANLNCANAGVVETTEEFQASCAEDGTTAQCCIVPLGADGLLCTAA
ncbi:hypothetical protein HBI56_099580 [Parastagonospora nodorum]|uniref:Hydrophobin n=2 Tax=Phaeosphaeria nodorum (strain SN15 / ATCC MYA-4574 / FGSC 10173) TaxID=321614 RepID=A0A7U2I286_PHANO|nr:hypothetical protein SNOG_06459 [Parastagonospora nodorum SN15]KAH3919075.1 hypothetical protein HBH56_028510 [Parastagonospora nodorum]EAT86290.1 hypothetical protein SNOG_06459 [Parastagonospora nodorum SN15]KAH3934578.1 hypothetical protein HBH54_053530 [Parastagonospora nodorum]KAH3949591.1 hypothetical protein HBH53_081200 [Parastagonospora nodorum]KAH3976004.1 hypothetical protein HBH51_084150 [Parastagonospora nodorum]